MARARTAGKSAKRPASKGSRKPVRAARKPVKTVKPKARPTKRPKVGKAAKRSGSAKPAKRVSPAPKGVQVKRPAAHKPKEDGIALGEFEVRMASASPVASQSPMAVAAKAATAQAGGALTYAQTGVNIEREDKAIEALAGMVNFSRIGFGAPMGRIGHFAGLVDFGPEHALVLCTDGVGSKVEIANAIRKWDTVGIDCMAMNVNDALCVGAEPLAFVDYLALQDPDPELTRQIGIGLNEGARQSNCSLIGGETASLPGIIKGFDLAGTCLAYVKKSDIVDGTKIAPGDVLIGLASTGIHSNGYSLARKAFERSGNAYTAPWPWTDDAAYAGKRVGDVLLEPTRIYVREIIALLRSGIPVHGLSHITGSGLRKLRRINQGVAYHITKPLAVQPVFQRVQELGGVADAEMYKTFNMGMGFVVVVPAAAAKKALAFLRSQVSYEVKIVGEVRAGKGVHHPIGGVH
ncbi:MAG: phosphoribosylformylglycinamidine cyclo-ligase [Candidatus Thermoplasmatota archaeon]